MDPAAEKSYESEGSASKGLRILCISIRYNRFHVLTAFLSTYSVKNSHVLQQINTIVRKSRQTIVK